MHRHRLLLAIVLLYAAAFRLLALDHPFHYDAEGSGRLYGMPVLTVGHIPDAPIVFYPGRTSCPSSGVTAQ